MSFEPQDALAPTPSPMTPIPTTLPIATFPMTTTTTSPTSDSIAGASYSKKPTLQTIQRVRQVFPES